jgi:hypothetical protein
VEGGRICATPGASGFPGGSSIARLLAKRRGVRNHHNLPRLTASMILAWADAFRVRTGRWPRKSDGAIAESKGDDWAAIDACLYQGHRGLPGGQTLARFLSEYRGARNDKRLPPYTEQQILAWTDAYHKRLGKWPKLHSGPIIDAPGETWMAVNAALHGGCRELPGGNSLALLLARRPAPSVSLVNGYRRNFFLGFRAGGSTPFHTACRECAPAGNLAAIQNETCGK